MFRKIVYTGLAALTLGVASLATTAPAQAARDSTNEFMFNPTVRPNNNYYYYGGRHFHGNGGYGNGGYRHHYGRRSGFGGFGLGLGVPFYGLADPGYGYDSYAPPCRVRVVRVRSYYGWVWQRRRICY